MGANLTDNPLNIDCGNTETSHRSPKLTKDLTSRINRIEGQVKGIRGMIEKGVYCDDVLTQISAAQSAMSSVAKLLLENHIKTCIVKKIQDGNIEVVDELIETVGKLLKKS